MKYITIRGRGEILSRIRKEAKNAKEIYFATDPDREGEAISWHLFHVLGVPDDKPCRIEFHEVTKKAVQNAVTTAVQDMTGVGKPVVNVHISGVAFEK